MRCPAAPSARLSGSSFPGQACYGSRPCVHPCPGLRPASPNALLYLGGGGAALRAGEGAMARDRPEGVQHQRLHPPPPGGFPGHQPLRGSGCHGEHNRRVCTSGGTWAGREASGPRMQAPERPGLQTVARDVHTQTKDWLHVHASPLKSQAWVGSRAEIETSWLSRHPNRVACSLGLWEEESGQRVGVASCLQGWEGEHSLV